MTPEHDHLGLPWAHVYGSTYHVYCYEFIITIVGINALQYVQSIVTQNMGQISHNVPITSELRSLLCNPHYRPPLITTMDLADWLSAGQWLITAELED